MCKEERKKERFRFIINSILSKSIEENEFNV